MAARFRLLRKLRNKKHRRPGRTGPAQHKAFEQLKTADKPVLLHGITSSGKTEVYIRLIDETLKANRQVLYLLPEIALIPRLCSPEPSRYTDCVIPLLI